MTRCLPVAAAAPRPSCPPTGVGPLRTEASGTYVTVLLTPAPLQERLTTLFCSQSPYRQQNGDGDDCAAPRYYLSPEELEDRANRCVSCHCWIGRQTFQYCGGNICTADEEEMDDYDYYPSRGF